MQIYELFYIIQNYNNYFFKKFYRHKNRRQYCQRFSFVIPERFERSTHSLEGCCSIQLSYETILISLHQGISALKRCKITHFWWLVKIYTQLFKQPIKTILCNTHANARKFHLLHLHVICHFALCSQPRELQTKHRLATVQG